MEPVVVQVSIEETDVTSERSSVSIRRLKEHQSKFHSVVHPQLHRYQCHEVCYKDFTIVGTWKNTASAVMAVLVWT